MGNSPGFSIFYCPSGHSFLIHCRPSIRGGAKGALAPPPHKKLLPQIVRRGSRGGQEGLGPPPPPYKILDPPVLVGHFILWGEKWGGGGARAPSAPPPPVPPPLPGHVPLAARALPGTTGQTVILYAIYILKGICTWFPLTGLDSVVKFCLTWSQFTYSMALDAYHIDSVNTCYD